MDISALNVGKTWWVIDVHIVLTANHDKTWLEMDIQNISLAMDGYSMTTQKQQTDIKEEYGKRKTKRWRMNMTKDKNIFIVRGTFETEICAYDEEDAFEECMQLGMYDLDKVNMEV